MIEADFFLIWNDEFIYSEIIPNYETLFLWIRPSESKIRVYYPMYAKNITKLNVNRRVQSIIRTGYFHPTGIRVGLGFEIEHVEQYEQFHEEKVITENKQNVTPNQWLEIMEEKARKITGSKLKELDLPTVDTNVKIYVNTFEAFDTSTNTRINKVNFYDEAHIISGEMLGNQKGFKIITSLNEELQYKFGILKSMSHLMTDVLMLLDLYYNIEENYGYYFGSFEMGEFTINKGTGELEIITKYSDITHAYSYLLTPDNNILIGFQDGSMRYINWKAGQVLIWESSGSTAASIYALTIWDKYFITGLNDGSIRLFNKTDGSLFRSHQIADYSITFVESYENYVIAGLEDGNKLYCFDLEREVTKWEIPIKKGKFISVKCNEGNVVVYTEKGFKFTIEISSGDIREYNYGHVLSCKPSKIGPWELLGSKNYLLYGNQISPSMDRHENEYSRISSIISMQDGVLVSCLDGKIEYLRKIVMEKV